MADGYSGQTVTLRGAEDDKEFQVPIEVAQMSQTIRTMLEDIDIGTDSSATIPLPNVSSRILEKVIRYCTYHYENPTPKSDDKGGENDSDGISAWDKEFCSVGQAVLFELVMAANYLDIKPLLELTCKTAASLIKGKRPEEIRKLFNIKNDFTPEEEEIVIKETEWCDER